LRVSVFAVLLVCSGNQCRSPAAAAILAAHLGAGFETASAGTAVPPAVQQQGRPIHPLTAAALADAGFVVPEHRAQPLNPQLVRSADLILTAERRHRTAVAQIDDGAARRTFTMLEFARLADQAPQDDLGVGPGTPSELVAGLVAGLAALRGRYPATTRDDLPDPIGSGPVEHGRLVATLAETMLRTAQALSSTDRR
jgi:protein-tyrosine phosphatase